MSTLINPTKLAKLDQIQLDFGSHGSFNSGHCSMEVVSWLADLGHTDAPACASPVLTRLVLQLNDRWDFGQRQKLKPYLPRLVGTAGDGKDELREKVAAGHVAGLLVPWLRLAGLEANAASVEQAGPAELALVLYEARRAAWKARDVARAEFRAKVDQRLKDRPVVDAVVVAVADAVAVADSAAVAVADAVADAVAASVADAADPYETAYNAARDYYRKHPLPVSEQIADLAAEQRDTALVLLDKLIDPEVA